MFVRSERCDVSNCSNEATFTREMTLVGHEGLGAYEVHFCLEHLPDLGSEKAELRIDDDSKDNT